VQLYDTTLRDGAQSEGISFSVGGSTNIIEASWMALADSLEYWLLKQKNE